MPESESILKRLLWPKSSGKSDADAVRVKRALMVMARMVFIFRDYALELRGSY